MTTTKQAAIAAAVLALGAGGFAGWKFSTAGKTRDALAALNARHEATVARIATLERQLATQATHAQAAESDNALLAGALKQVEVARTEKIAKDAAPVTREGVMARLARAQTLARTGDAAEALRELLWCYDEGFPRLGGTAMSSGITSVISALGALGTRYPEALAVLRERRDVLRQQVLAGPGGSDAVGEFSAVVLTLKDDRAMLDLFDQVPPGDSRRRMLGIYAFEPLIAARRYGEAAEARSYASMVSTFEMISQERPLPANMPNPERIRETMRKSAIGTMAKNIEVMAGAGDVAHARALADRLLAYDNSEATKALILQHATRAGRADLLAAPAP